MRSGGADREQQTAERAGADDRARRIGQRVRPRVARFPADGGLLLSRLSSGELDPGAIVTHRLPLADAVEAYRLFDSREATKVVMMP